MMRPLAVLRGFRRGWSGFLRALAASVWERLRWYGWTFRLYYLIEIEYQEYRGTSPLDWELYFLDGSTPREALEEDRSYA